MLGEHVVGLRSDQLDDLGAKAAEHRLPADVCLRVTRAVPVEIVAAGAPAAPVVLGEGDFQVADVPSGRSSVR